MSRTFLLLIVAVVAAPAADTATAQLPFNIAPAGPIDINQLKQDTLSQVLPAAAQLPAAALGAKVGGLPADPVMLSWGLKTDAMPELYHRLPELQQRGGIYISHVEPASPAARAGLVKGLVVLEINGEPVDESRSLGFLQQPTELTLLTSKGPQRVTVQPRVRLHNYGPGTMHPHLGNSLRNVNVGRRIGGWNATPGSAVAVSMVNGAYAIEASVPTADGQQKVQLSGTREEVETQLAKLPATVADAIRSQM
ncbi:hypothetical protein Pla123a_29380 [Posidoniimonas polymericola]|uniref:PDZ domain-containing protein n=1 Tax=Posidoniimonas polymericola TaxID=2528002 RepID=A0A5C5YMT3_9BACT|nr:PDZ domain-containing protein [Posidoniimonas polymericola]TWT76149.1 hypothetical protein Pla123a_29380 [Posidoniimonas polymericola]